MTRRSVLFCAMALLAQPAVAEPVRLILERCGELPSASVRVAALADDESSPPQPLVVEASTRLGETLELALPDGHQWRLYVVSTAFWTEPGRPLDPRKETVVRLAALPSSVLAGRLAVARGERLPSEIVLRLGRAKEAGGGEGVAMRPGVDRCSIQQATITCPVDDEGRFECGVPAGRWNVRVKAERWAGRHLWDLELLPQEPTEVGVLSLRHGSTLIGEVTTVDGPADPRITRIRLQPVTSRDPGAGSDSEIERELTVTAALNAQGFFVFEQVAPGGYTVVAHQPGYAPSTALRIELVEDRETALREPIVLRPPLRLAVHVTPPIAPQGERWRLELARQRPIGDQYDLAASGPADEEGVWEVEGLPPGSYRLELFDPAGNPLVAEGPLLLDSGEGLELAISVDLLEVSGRVFVGDEPLAGAELWFGGRYGETRVRVGAGEEGEFATSLPRSGDWLLDVLSEDPRVVHRGRTVEVPAGGGELEIRLPGTRVRGRVLDEASQRPVGSSVVRFARADRQAGASAALADGKGEFELWALDPGSYLVQAESGEARSEMSAVEVRSGSEPPALTLVLRRRRALAGLVTSEHGGVPGARVEILPFAGAGELVEMSVPTVVTDAAGRFEVEVPSATREVLITILPPGFGLTLVRAGIDDLAVPVAPPDGTLRLARPTSDAAAAGAEVELVMVDGQPVDLPTLIAWATLNQGITSASELVVSAMPAGSYRYCLLRFDEALAVFAGRAQPTRCAAGLLTPGGELVLAAP